MRFTTLCIWAVLVAAPAFADGETLIPIPVELEPETEIERPVEKSAATTPKSVAVKAKNTPFARVAHVIVHKGIIRDQPKDKSLLFYRCDKGTELAVLGQQGNWSKIVMSDRSIGWMRTNQLRMTDIQVEVTQVIFTARHHVVKSSSHGKHAARKSGLNKRGL